MRYAACLFCYIKHLIQHATYKCMKLFAFHIFFVCMFCSLANTTSCVLLTSCLLECVLRFPITPPFLPLNFPFTFTCKKKSFSSPTGFYFGAFTLLSLPPSLCFTLHRQYFFLSLSLIRLSPCFLYIFSTLLHFP